MTLVPCRFGTFYPDTNENSSLKYHEKTHLHLPVLLSSSGTLC
jgi:hypothetical protein